MQILEKASNSNNSNNTNKLFSLLNKDIKRFNFQERLRQGV